MNLKKIINVLIGGYCIVSLLAILYFAFFYTKVTNVSVMDVTFSSAPVQTVQTLVADDADDNDADTDDGTTDDTDNNNNGIIAYRFRAIHGKGNLHIRKGPSPSYKVISTVKPGTEGLVITKGGLWSKVKVNDIEGYVFNHYMEFIPLY